MAIRGLCEGDPAYCKRTRCLSHIEGTWDDGTEWQIEITVFWDDPMSKTVRVCADITTFGPNPGDYIPTTSYPADDFIMAPDGTFVGE
jgi:hypothetical protein